MKYPISRKLADELIDKVHRLREPTLKKLIVECNNLTSSNCAWHMYALRNALKDFAQMQLKYLRRNKARIEK